MTALILLAGGRGTRLGSATPKVFLPLDDKPMALHAFETLSPLVSEVVVVCPEEYRSLFPKKTPFAEPGERRQDSVKNGFLTLKSNKFVLIHDAARPFVTKEAVIRLLEKGGPIGAAALATPAQNTIKETDNKGLVKKTLDRSRLWDVQTPQLIRYDWLEEGLKTDETVTDDVSLVERLGYPVLLVPGDPANVKITYPSDLAQAEAACAIS